MHYEKLLYPYDIFLVGASGEAKRADPLHQNSAPSTHTPPKKFNSNSSDKACCESPTKTVQNDQSPASKSTHRMSRRSTSQRNNCSPSTATTSSSFARLLRRNQALSEQQSPNTTLQSPCKTSVASSPVRSSSALASATVVSPTSATLQPLLYTNGKQVPVCHLCNESDRTRRILQCARCEKYVHMNCLFPSLSMVPKANWHCATCIEQMLPQMPQPYTNEFGFVESRRRYSLAEFGLLANEFKSKYFGELQNFGIALSTVEKEFWRLVASIEDTVTVEYGADLHTNQVGSGFATRKSTKTDSKDSTACMSNADFKSKEDMPGYCSNRSGSEVYVDHPWNLNRLPLLDGSLFRYVNGNINGMIVPWIYVGMCFSTFCWHNEDHWTYSINYLHFGDAKTWYGVPGESAAKFERAMEAIAPDLFAAQPDLLHQLVTTCNPALLSAYDVPIYRLDQLPGEFVVTFPRAYHAGFNQGFNLAEAVNFAPLDWLPLGRRSVREYARLRRYPVFSHEELLFRMAQDDTLPTHHVQRLFVELLHVIRAERDQRRALLDMGIHQSQHVPFDQLPDEQRQCKHCRSTCYLSALICDCDLPSDVPPSQVCLDHIHRLCSNCPPDRWTMRHTYKLDQLCDLLKRLSQRVNEYNDWAFQVATELRLSSAELQSMFDLDHSNMNRNDQCNMNASNLVSTDEIMKSNELLQQKDAASNVLFKRLMAIQNDNHDSDAGSRMVTVETLESLIQSAKKLYVPPTDHFWIALVQRFSGTSKCAERLVHLQHLIHKSGKHEMHKTTPDYPNDAKEASTRTRLPLDEVRDLLQMALFSQSDQNHFVLQRAYNDVHELQHRLRELTEANLATESLDLDCVKQLIDKLHFVDVDRDLRRLTDQKPHLSYLLQL